MNLRPDISWQDRTIEQTISLFATDFADQAVVLPLAGAVALLLMALRRPRDALVWVLVVGATLGTMLILKIAARDCAWAVRGMGAGNPSGHTAGAAVVYGGLAALLVGRRAVAIPAAAAVACLIGFTRLALGKHTTGDVQVGAAIGVIGAVAFAWLLRPQPHVAASKSGPLLIGAAVVLLVFHGYRLAAEERIAAAASDVWPFSECVVR